MRCRTRKSNLPELTDRLINRLTCTGYQRATAYVSDLTGHGQSNFACRQARRQALKRPEAEPELIRKGLSSLVLKFGLKGCCARRQRRCMPLLVGYACCFTQQGLGPPQALHRQAHNASAARRQAKDRRQK